MDILSQRTYDKIQMFHKYMGVFKSPTSHFKKLEKMCKSQISR